MIPHSLECSKQCFIQLQKPINRDNITAISINTKRYFDVDSTFFESYGRQMDVKTTLCAYWDRLSFGISRLKDFLKVSRKIVSNMLAHG